MTYHSDRYTVISDVEGLDGLDGLNHLDRHLSDVWIARRATSQFSQGRLSLMLMIEELRE